MGEDHEIDLNKLLKELREEFKDQFGKVEITRMVVSTVVGVCVSKVAVDIMRNNTTTPLTNKDILMRYVGVACISAYIADRASTMTDNAITGVVKMWTRGKRLREGAENAKRDQEEAEKRDKEENGNSSES